MDVIRYHVILKQFLLPGILCCFHFLQAQNIVPNGDFEDVNICSEYNARCSPSAWFFANKAGSLGFVHDQFNHIPAASGTQYLEFKKFPKTDNSRQYWETMLLCKLVRGEKYTASIKIAASNIGPNVNDIGIYFSNEFIFSYNDTLLQPAIYLNFLDARVTKLKNNWFFLSKEFTATSDAQFLILGNFSAEPNSKIVEKRVSSYGSLNLMADDISISPKNTTCPGQQKIKDSLYAITKRHKDTVKLKKDTTIIVQTSTKKIDTLHLSNLLFEFNQYKLLTPDTLEAFRAVLTNPAIRKIEVIGYTDDAGTAAYNKDFSSKRAAEIAIQIASRFGIAASVIHAEGKGVSTYYDTKNLNRRVDIYIYY